MPDANRADIDATLGLEHDILQGTTLEAGLRLGLSREAEDGVVARDEAHTLTAGVTLGVTQAFGRSEISLRGAIDREMVGVPLLDTARARQTDRDVTQYGATLRYGYEVSEGLTPFVEAGIDRRNFDETRDRNGRERGSLGLSGRVGVEIEVDETLRGEVSAGYAWRGLDDRRLDDLDGLTLAGRLTFEATPLTRFTLAGSTELDDATLAESSGSIVRTASLAIEHDLMRNLTLTASLALEQSRPDAGASSFTARAALGAEYVLIPEVALTGGYNYEREWAARDRDDFDAHAVLLGITVRR